MLLPLVLAFQAPLAVTPDTTKLVHNALHYDVTILVRDSAKHILGEVETTWLLTSSDPVVVPLDSAFRVIRVLIDGKENTRLYRTRYGRNDQIVYIPHEKQAGDTLKTRIRYHGTPRDGLIFATDSAGDHTVFADNWPDRAHRWLPVQDHPSDKATINLSVEVGPGAKVIANGDLVKVDTLPYGNTTWRYRLDRRVSPYNFVFGAGKLAVTRLEDGGCATRCIPVSVWSYRQDSAFAVQSFAKAPAMLDYFASLIGEFPFNSLAHVQSTTTFGGMENATAIFYDTKMYKARNVGEGLIAHETAHQWFGDAVTEADWHHLWLSEGFATYLAHMWTEHSKGQEAMRAEMKQDASQIFKSKSTSRPIIDVEATDLLGLLNTNNYQKGSWVLHELRGLIGDSAFVHTLREFYRTRRDSTALSSDFAALASAQAGKDLNWFFTQELTQPGYPRLSLDQNFKKGKLTLTIRQVQPAEWGVRRIPALVVDIDGARYSVNVAEQTTRFTTSTKKAPGKVVLDPDGRWLLEVVGAGTSQ